MDTKQLIGEELKKYLMKRFNYTEEQAEEEMERREKYNDTADNKRVNGVGKW